MKNTNLKLLVLALVGLFLTNCQRDEVETTPKKEIVTTNATDDLASAVSINEAKTLFETAETQKQTSNASARSSKLFIELPLLGKLLSRKNPFRKCICICTHNGCGYRRKCRSALLKRKWNNQTIPFCN